jgi:rfaE bifunctional protein kinase chain/domain
MERERLTRLLGAFRGREVLVLGDLVADRFLHGDIERVSREAPVLILRETERKVVPGGGGNTIMNLCSLGARPFAIGAVGRDEQGQALRDQLRKAGAKVGSVVQTARYQTPTKTRVVAGGIHTRRQQVVRIDNGSRSLPATMQDRLVRNLARSFERGAGLIIADYDLGAATPAILAAARRLTRARPTFTLVDSRRRLTSFRGITAATPNQEELEGSTETKKTFDESQIRSSARSLRSRLGAEAICVTRGARGMMLVEKNRHQNIPAFGPDEVADVTGAGDTVMASFALALTAGASYADAAALANIAAGLVVMKAGTATITVDELRRALTEETA